MEVKRVLVSLLFGVSFVFFETWSNVNAWEPAKPVEFIIMAGQGGGADKYARLISGLVDKHKLAPVPMVPINKVGGAGAVAMEYVHGKKGDDYTIMITLSSFVMTPIAQKLPLTTRPLPLSRFSPWTTFSSGSTKIARGKALLMWLARPRSALSKLAAQAPNRTTNSSSHSLNRGRALRLSVMSRSKEAVPSQPILLADILRLR